MSGRLIILPKKRWNVWNRENIAKVRYDEQQHQLKLEEEKSKQRNVDAEARLQLLRRRAGGEESEDKAVDFAVVKREEGDEAVSIHTETGHINFFQDMEHALDGNEEYEAEKRELEMKEMRKQGIAPTGLGESAQTAAKPWYDFVAQGKAAPRVNRHGKLLDDAQLDKATKIDHSRKRRLDPMSGLVSNDPVDQAAVPEQPARLTAEQRDRSPSNSESSDSSDTESRRKRRKNKSKKEKKKHKSKKSKKRKKESSKEKRSDPPSKTLEQLRAERLHREAVERARSSRMLSHHTSSKEEADFALAHAARQERRYNSAFFQK